MRRIAAKLAQAGNDPQFARAADIRAFPLTVRSCLKACQGHNQDKNGTCNCHRAPVHFGHEHPSGEGSRSVRERGTAAEAHPRHRRHRHRKEHPAAQPHYARYRAGKRLCGTRPARRPDRERSKPGSREQNERRGAH